MSVSVTVCPDVSNLSVVPLGTSGVAVGVGPRCAALGVIFDVISASGVASLGVWS